MKLIEKLRTILKQETKFPTATKHITKFAFEIGGVKYYEFDTIANLPYKRAMKFFSVYDELSMKCDAFYLNAHVKAIKTILTGGKKVGLEELSKVLSLNNQLEERLTWVHSEDLVYKLASVVFFDANESPDDWEWQYAIKKIEYWKQNESVAAFVFFARANSEVIALFKRFSIDFPELFGHSKEDRQSTVGKTLASVVGSSEDKFTDLYRQVVLGGDETKFSQVDDTIYEFFTKLSKGLKRNTKTPNMKAGGRPK